MANVKHYTQAMTVDQETGKPKPKTQAELESSRAIIPVDVQARYAQTVQTHSSVSVAPNGLSPSSFIDVKGFDKIGIVFKSDGNHTLRIKPRWSFDGTTPVTTNVNVISGTNTDGAIEIPIVAPYLGIELRNDDSIPHVMTAWAYLKA